METTKPRRGRPAGLMTHRRRQVLEAFTAQAAQGQRVSIARLVRACGLHDRSSALRIIRDLRRMGRLG
jgi:hypothetical protein